MSGILRDFVVLLSFITFFYTFFRFNFRENKLCKFVGIIISFLILILCLIIIPDFNGIHIGPISLPLLWCFFFLFFLFDIGFWELIIYGIAAWLIICMFEMVILVNCVDNSSMVEKIAFPISITIISIMWITFILFKKKKDNLTFRLTIKIWVIIDIIMIVLMLMMSFFTQVIVDLLTEKYKIIGIRLSTIGGIALIFLLLSLVYCYEKISESRINESISSMMIVHQKDYYEQLLIKEEETKQFRHEITGNYIRMLGYCKKGQYGQLKSYINNELGIIDEISRSDYNIGNYTVNSILNYYLRPLKERYDIVVSGFVSDKIDIEARDLSVIFANLISNAVEAVSKNEQGKILIEIEQGNDYLRSVLKNTFTGEVIYDSEGNPVTSKKDKDCHGIGLKNVKKVLKKYDGIIDIKAENGIFETEVILKTTVHG